MLSVENTGFIIMTPQNIDIVKVTVAACIRGNSPIVIDGYIDAAGVSKDLIVQVIGREGYIQMAKDSLDTLQSKVIELPSEFGFVDWLEATTQLEESLKRTLEGANAHRQFADELEDSGNGYFRNPLKPGVIVLRHMRNMGPVKHATAADLLTSSRTGVTAAKKYINGRLPLATYLGQLNIEEGRYASVTGVPEMADPITEESVLGAPLPEGSDGNPTVAATTIVDFPKATEITVLSDSYVSDGLVGTQDYQALALRTEAPAHGILERILSNPDRYLRLIHASLGLSSEMGELLESEDSVNTRGELSDCCWFSAVGLQALGKPLLSLEKYNASPIPAENIKGTLEFLNIVVAEFADFVKAHVFYGKQEFKGENGSKSSADELLEKSLHAILGLVAGLAVAHGTDFLSILRANIAKLSARYPGKYSQEAALNRDPAKENAAISAASK